MRLEVNADGAVVLKEVHEGVILKSGDLILGISERDGVFELSVKPNEKEEWAWWVVDVTTGKIVRAGIGGDRQNRITLQRISIKGVDPVYYKWHIMGPAQCGKSVKPFAKAGKQTEKTTVYVYDHTRIKRDMYSQAGAHIPRALVCRLCEQKMLGLGTPEAGV